MPHALDRFLNRRPRPRRPIRGAPRVRYAGDPGEVDFSPGFENAYRACPTTPPKEGAQWKWQEQRVETDSVDYGDENAVRQAVVGLDSRTTSGRKQSDFQPDGAKGKQIKRENGADTVDGGPEFGSTARTDEGEHNALGKKLLKIIRDVGGVVHWLVFAVVYIIDCGSDLAAAHFYFIANEYWNFCLTALIVALSSLTIMAINLYFYSVDYRNEKRAMRGVGGTDETAERGAEETPQTETWVWALRFGFTIVFLGPFVRCIEIAHRGNKARLAKDEEKKWYQTVRDFEIYDVAVLGLIEAFMENAPQLALQLYIMQTQGPEKDTMRLIVQTVACVSSWVSCACAITTFTRANRQVQEDKAKLTTPALVVQFLWRLFTLGPRILAMALFASLSEIRMYVIVAVAFHWLFGTIYVISRPLNYCSNIENDEDHEEPRYVNGFVEILFKIVVGFVYIFTYWNIEPGHTRYRYAVYYTMIYLENLAMVITWFVLTPQWEQWYYIPSFLFIVVGFPLGIAFMFAYYTGLHPQTITLCLTKEKSVVPKDEPPVQCDVEEISPT